MIYFDNAATSFPKPAAVKAGAFRYFYELGANPGRSGHDLSAAVSREIYRCREEAAGFFGLSDPAKVVFTQNCTHSLNLLIKGILKRGDHVVISDLEHNSVLRPVYAMAQKGLITYDIACVDPVNEENTLAAFAECIQPRTKMVLATHCSNVFGIVLPIKRLAALAHAKGVYFGLDAAQSAGVLPVFPERDGLDFVAMPGHKGLYGPTGTGLLLINSYLVPDSLTEGGTGSLSLEYSQPEELPERLESGTVNTLGILGLREGIAFVKKTGLEAIYRHEERLCRKLAEILAEMPKTELYTDILSRPRRTIGGLLSFNILGKNSEETAQLLNRKGFAVRGGYHCAPLAHKKMGTIEGERAGTVRVSPGFFNTEKQIDQFCRAVKEIAAS